MPSTDVNEASSMLHIRGPTTVNNLTDKFWSTAHMNVSNERHRDDGLLVHGTHERVK